MNERLSKIKNKIKENKFEIIWFLGSIIPMTITYAAFLNKLANDRQAFMDDQRRFPVGGTTYLATNVALEPVTNTEATSVIWEIEGHKFDLLYDPEC
jgi:hypothetical protein